MPKSARLLALLCAVLTPSTPSAQTAPAPLAPYRYTAAPIVFPPGYEAAPVPLAPPITGGGVVLGQVTDPNGRVVPFSWSAATGFLDLADVIDAALPSPIVSFQQRRINGSGVATGFLVYHEDGAVVSQVFVYDAIAQKLSLHGDGIGVAINEAGDVLIGSPSGFELLQDGVRTSNYSLSPWPGGGGWLATLLEDGSFISFNFGLNGVFRWMNDGTTVEITPPGALSPIDSVNANIHGDLLISGPNQQILTDSAGNVLREFETWSNLYYLSDDRAVFRAGYSSAHPPVVAWNGHWVALLSLLDAPQLNSAPISSVDRTGNILGLDYAFGGGALQWDGVPVDGVYLERQLDVRPVIAMRTPFPVTNEGSQHQLFPTTSDTEIEIDLFGGEPSSPAAILLAPPGVPPFVMAAGTLSADGEFTFTVPVAAGTSYPGASFDVIGVSLMSSSPLELGISLPQSFELLP